MNNIFEAKDIKEKLSNENDMFRKVKENYKNVIDSFKNNFEGNLYR